MARHSLHFEQRIERLENMILFLGTLVVENLQKSLKSLNHRDSALSCEVINFDSNVDNMEVFVEEECLNLLVLYQPVANDLRLIVAILKINSDLEQIGNLAVSIAERAVFLSSRESITIPEDFNRMARKTQVMLQGSLDSLANRDSGLARKICEADDDVDEINRKMYGHLGKNIRTHPDRLDCFTHLLSASRHLERVADHATNIAEDVIYLVEGEIVRHRRETFQPSGKQWEPILKWIKA